MSRLNIVVILMVAVLLGALFSVFTPTANPWFLPAPFAEPGMEFKVSGTLDTDHPVRV